MTQPPLSGSSSLSLQRPVIRITHSSPETAAQAMELAAQLSLPLYKAGADDYDYLLEYSEAGLSLLPSSDKGYGSIRCDFAAGEHNHRRLHGGGNGQAIAKAVGVSGKFAPQVLDLTAGLGGDGFVLASLGCTVTLVERNAVVHSLLADGLRRGIEVGQCDPELARIMARLRLHQASSSDYLQSACGGLKNVGGLEKVITGESESQPQADQWQPDVVYIDPMFPLRKKSAKVKKEMQAFHEIVGSDSDADDLLARALAAAQYRVVVKRPAGAGFLAETKPSYSLKGKSTRYDIYALKKLPQ
jgi:16S rRNA (guanine1516-N2)-methyltransferase